jgi:hypothetical protein
LTHGLQQVLLELFQSASTPAFPVVETLSHASDLLHIAKLLASDAAMVRDTDRHAWASHYLQEMSKAIIDDVVKVLDAPGNNRSQ